MTARTRRRIAASRRVWFGLTAAVAVLACERPGDMRGCRAHWDALSRSKSESEETRRVDRFADCADQRGLRYSLVLKNLKTGAAVSFAEYQRVLNPLRLTLTLEGKRDESFDWTPRKRENIAELMRE